MNMICYIGTIGGANNKWMKCNIQNALFQGEFMGTTFTRNSFIRENRLHYKLKYIEKMEVLMKLLIEQGDYTGAAGYCNDILKVYPDCVDIHFGRIVALYKQG